MPRIKGYEEACDDGYDGPSPIEEWKMRHRRHKNAMLDPRDPDYEPENEESEEEQDDDSTD